MLSYEMTAKTQERLDEEIAQLAIKLSSLRTQKNTFAPISRLPQSILACIFVYHAHEDYHTSSGSHIPRHTKSHWIGMSYVCRHWRHVALNCPALWSYLLTASPPWTEALLIRSLNLPLRIRVALLTSQKALDFIAQVSLHTERFEECYIYFQLARSDVTRALSMLSLRGRHLRKLEIETDQECIHSDEHVQTGEVEDHILFFFFFFNPFVSFVGRNPYVRHYY